MLILTTTRRLTLPFLAFLIWTPVAHAWSWPVQGPVLQPFSYDAAHPYASGQHRGIDIGADAAGETVLAPAAGTVSFAGSVPTSGKSVTIETGDGYSVTLTHLGSFAVAEGVQVAEQDAIGTVGPSGTPELDVPYLHLGIRVTADPNGYVDPLGLLPPVTASGATDTGSTASQPSSSGASAAAAAASPPSTSGGSSAAQSTEPATSIPATAPVATTRGSTAATTPGKVAVHEHRHAQKPRTVTHPARSPQRAAVRTVEVADLRSRHTTVSPRRRAGEAAGSSRRPVVEPAALGRRAGLEAGHEARPGVPATVQPRREPSSPLLDLLCNGAAALFALGAALAADRRRRRSKPGAAVGARVLHLAPPAEHRHASRAA